VPIRPPRVEELACGTIVAHATSWAIGPRRIRDRTLCTIAHRDGDGQTLNRWQTRLGFRQRNSFPR
jgi:hypothetical protein